MKTTDEREYSEARNEGTAETMGRGAVKGMAWLGAIVAIFGVSLLFAWLVSKDNPLMANHSDISPLAYSSFNANSIGSAETPMVLVKEKEVPVQNTIIIVTRGTKSSPAVTSTKAKSREAKAASNVSDESRIEREAREVIEGDYGDNPGRKAKLGADYAAVQARVNEMLY